MASDPLADYYYGQLGVPQTYIGAMENLGFQGNPFGNQQQNYSDIQNWQKSFKGILDSQIDSYGTNNVSALPYNLYNMFASAAPIYSNPQWGPTGGGHLFSQNGWQSGTDLGGHGDGLGGWRSNMYQQYIDRVNAPPPPPVSSMSTTPGLGSGTGQSVSTPFNGGTQQFTVGNGNGGSTTVNAHDLQSALDNVPGNNGKVQQGGYRF